MKFKFLAIVPGLLLFACNAAPGPGPHKVQSQSSENTLVADAESVDLEASSSLYLSDMVDSATTPTEGAKVEDSVKEDLKAERLKAAAQRLMTALDADGNKALSEGEFLAILEKMGGKCKDLSPEKLLEVQTKFKESYKVAAGADGSLSLEEIEVLLKDQALRIGKFRDKEHKGRQGERIKQTFEETLAKYDKDGDKKLSKEEFEAMRADLMATAEAGQKSDLGRRHSSDNEQPDSAEEKAKADKIKEEKEKGKAESSGEDKAGDGSVIVVPKPA